MVTFRQRRIVPIRTVTREELVVCLGEHLRIVEVCDTLSQQRHHLNRILRESATLLKYKQPTYACLPTITISHATTTSHHHVVPATALSHRTARPSIFAMSSLFGLSPKSLQFVIMWPKSHVAVPHIQVLLSLYVTTSSVRKQLKIHQYSILLNNAHSC